MDTVTDNGDSLIVKTHDLICSDDKTRVSSRLPSHVAKSLKNTTHVKALATALQMARAHHAVAVEVAMAGKEETTAPIVINHHLCALQLITSARRLRAASQELALKGRRPTPTLMSEIQRDLAASNASDEKGGAPNTELTTSGHDLSVVSYDPTLML